MDGITDHLGDSYCSSSTVNNEEDICRDYLRNMCTRGNRCKYKHPEGRKAAPQQGNFRQMSSSGLVFCHDFQNTICSRVNCRFFHGSRQVEEHYRATGDIPGRLPERAKQSEGIEVCKEHLSTGECHWGRNCKYLHVGDLAVRGSPDPKRRMIRQHSTERLPGQQLDMLSLCEENILLRRQVEELKKQVTDLMATNELLLDQNAHLRIHGKVPQTVTSVTVTLPSVSLPVTSFSHHHGLAVAASIPTVQTVQALATLPLVTALAQSGSATIPFASSMSLTTQPPPLGTVSIAPVTLHQPVANSLPSAATATVTLTPNGTLEALHHHHHHHGAHSSALTFSGASGGSLVSYPAIMTQSLMAPPTELR